MFNPIGQEPFKCKKLGLYIWTLSNFIYTDVALKWLAYIQTSPSAVFLDQHRQQATVRFRGHPIATSVTMTFVKQPKLRQTHFGFPFWGGLGSGPQQASTLIGHFVNLHATVKYANFLCKWNRKCSFIDDHLFWLTASSRYTSVINLRLSQGGGCERVAHGTLALTTMNGKWTRVDSGLDRATGKRNGKICDRVHRDGTAADCGGKKKLNR